MMEVDQYNLVDQIIASDYDIASNLIITIKNAVIGNNKQKAKMISMGLIPRLVQFVYDDSTPLKLKVDAAIVMGSLAKGTKADIQALYDSGVVEILLKALRHDHLPLVEASLRCLKTVFQNLSDKRYELFEDATLVPHMINILSKSNCTKECIATILATCCMKTEDQNMICGNGAIPDLAPLLKSHVYKVQLSALQCIATLCRHNKEVSAVVSQTLHDGVFLPNIILSLLRRDQTIEIQMNAAKCMTYMYRVGAIADTDNVISLKTMPTLVRMCSSCRTWEERVEGAETLAYLTEVDSELQYQAATCDHIITTISEYFRYPGPGTSHVPTEEGQYSIVGNRVRQAAFLVYASLAANDEEIRKRIIEAEQSMTMIVHGLSDPIINVQLAAVRCMHSLSRSVQQLRTSFYDHAVWKPLMEILISSPEEVRVIASSTLCNLLLDFSPSKQPLMDQGVIELLVSLTTKENEQIRLNGIWALMNLAFQAEKQVKMDILSALGAESLFRLLSDANSLILMKTLGLLRNLLTSKPHIDLIMEIYGVRIMQAVILILEGDHVVDIKEQALCIIANIGDGNTAKSYVMGNDDILKKIMSYMNHSSVQLQIAAVYCVTNLVWHEDNEVESRQEKLKEIGVQKRLQELLNSDDATLYEKVKTTVNQFR